MRHQSLHGARPDGRWGQPWRDLWDRRNLLYVFVWRDLKVRYKQTLLGAAWAVLQPLLAMLVFTFVFGRVARVPSDGLPYPVFVYCGLLPWQFFVQGLSRSSGSLVEHRYLLTRMFVPRLALPISAVLGGAPDFVASLAVLVSLMAFYGIYPTAAALAIFPLLALAAAAALAGGLFLSAVNVRYRDVAYALPFLTQFWFFLTPVAYPSSLVPERWRWLVRLNPMAAVVEGFRQSLAQRHLTAAAIDSSWVAAGIVLVLGTLGCGYFLERERTFADVI